MNMQVVKWNLKRNVRKRNISDKNRFVYDDYIFANENCDAKVEISEKIKFCIKLISYLLDDVKTMF